MDRALRLGFVASGLTFLLLLASLTSAGTGPFGFPWMRHPLWSYGILAAAIALLLMLTPPRKTGQEAEPNDPPYPA
jgi:hypothetical protein